MAGMAFEVSAKFYDLEQLKQKIAETRAETKRFYEEGNKGEAKKMEKQLQGLLKEHDKLSKSLEPVIYQYQKLGDTGKKTAELISKLAKTGEVTEQMKIQKQVIKDLETQYDSYLQMCKKLDKEGYVTFSQK